MSVQNLDLFFNLNSQTIEKERKSPYFSWNAIIKQYNLDIKAENLRGRYKQWRKKNCVTTTENNFPVSQTWGEYFNANPEMVHAGLNTETQTFSYVNGNEDKAKGTKTFTFTADNIPTEQEIIDHFNIDITKWYINQVYHKTSFGGKYAITVSQLALKGNQALTLNDKFLEDLKSVPVIPKGAVPAFKEQEPELPSACLVIPKQDIHWNKYDIDGNNSMEMRFVEFMTTVLIQLDKVKKLNKLDKIIYVVGSDEFNSEWTIQTTKGTPQQNILGYQEAFEKVSKFSISFIKLLLGYSSKVEVVLLNGNHDHNVSWHLANLLSHVFSETPNVKIDTDLKNTKILEYGQNLILVNHGDEMKPKELATKFPIIAKEKWSNYNNFVCISGDKHHEVAHDYNGVRTYQVPQLSKAKSFWDDKKGHVCSKAELVTFLFEEKELSLILRNEI